MTNDIPPNHEVLNHDRPLGLLLRDARQARGLSPAEVGQRLHLQGCIIDAIERNDFERLGASVYAKGYLNSYARLVGVPTAHVDSALAVYQPPAPPLKSATHIPHWRHLYDRYAKRVTYVALTGVIVFPIVLMGLRERLPIDPPLLHSLDEFNAAAEDGQGAEQSVASQSQQPVTASLAPFYRESTVDQPVAEVMEQVNPAVPGTEVVATPDVIPTASAVNDPADTMVAAGGHMVMVFRGSSWVEVTSHNGKRLAYGLVAAGETRRFVASNVSGVSIGNADAVDVTLNGRELKLEAYRHAKVARFTLSSAGKISAAGG